MAKYTKLANGEFAVVRSAASAIAADNVTLTDANIDPAQIVDCTGLDTILVGCEITGGTGPTMTIEALFRDSDTDVATGSRWKRILLGAAPGVTPAALGAETTGALAPYTQLAELRVFGWSRVFLRITAVANATSTTAWAIIAAPGRRR